jgi:hypothetical protein
MSEDRCPLCGGERSDYEETEYLQCCEECSLPDSLWPQVAQLKAIAEAAGELDADAIFLFKSSDIFVIVTRAVIDKIQEAWLGWKGVKHE